MHHAKNFVFTDLKMNSNLDVWNTIHDRFQQLVSGGSWIGSVHVDSHRDNGLSAQNMKQAAEAGMVRVTTGLESGSQRILEKMKKGTNLKGVTEFLHNATAAGVSTRVTMIVGYPGEEPEDVRQTAEFLKQHGDAIERVLVNRFQLMSGTTLHRSVDRHPDRYPTVTNVAANHRIAQVDHDLTTTEHPAYRREITNVLRAAHEINRRPLHEVASAFEGVM